MEVGTGLNWERVGEFLLSSLILGVAVLLAFGLSYWAYRARTDRSAHVGLYLLFGLPGFLLAGAGLALAVNGRREGLLLLLLGLGLGLPLLKPVRRLFAAVTPMDPASPVDMVGLCLVLAVTGGLIYGIVRSSGPASDVPSVGIADLVLQAAAELGVAYAAVGWWFARSLSQATERLGLRLPTRRTWLAAGGFLVAAFVAVAIGGLIIEVVQPEVADELEPVTDELTADVQNPVGAAVLGLSAGVGEEAIFRGALQPRFGIPLTSMLFALVHAPQYGFSLAIFSLFVVGVLLGLERRYFGTTAAILTHAAFNALVVLIQAAA